MKEDERLIDNVKGWLSLNRGLVFWSFSIVLSFWLLIAVKELTALVFLSYGIAILLDPIVSRWEKRGISRSLSIIGLMLGLVLLILIVIAVAIPALVQEYHTLIIQLPGYLESAARKFEGSIRGWLGKDVSFNVMELFSGVKSYISALGVEEVRRMGQTIGKTVLQGYSFALTVLNLFLLPFLVYYIAKDLRLIHEFIGGILPKDTRSEVSKVGNEILKHVYSFFRGQITVSCIMACLYAVGLFIVGLPSAIIVGAMAGLLNIVPYLGVALGLVLAMVITIVTDFSWLQIAKVGGVFAFVQALEGTVLTPKIVGESVGIHPLGVMLALIVGGQLFGLVGLILAIPAAAAVRVLFNRVLMAIESEEEVGKEEEEREEGEEI